MKPGYTMLIVVACALRDRGAEWRPAFDAVLNSAAPIAEGIRQMGTLGMTPDEIANAMAPHPEFGGAVDDGPIELGRSGARPVFERARQNDTAVQVYVMQAPNGHVKVGISQHPNWRAKALSAEWRGLPTVLWVSVARSRREATDIERRAHQELAEWRIEGEWFACTPEQAVAAIQAAEDAAL